MSDRLTLVDGEFEDKVPASDRGFLFGDHVFETMLWNGRSVPLWDLHWQRLEKSCEQLGFDAPKESHLLADIECLMSAHDAGMPCILRLTVTRGSSATGYWVPDDLKPRRVLQRREFPAFINQHQVNGVRVATGAMTLPSSAFALGLKHGNRLFQVMCAKECALHRVDEVLIYRENGCLAEAMASNVIVVQSGCFMVPDCPDVSGVGLAWLESLDLRVKKSPLTRLDISRADELILINSVAGPRPVVELDGQSLIKGKACRSLQSHWQSVCSR